MLDRILIDPKAFAEAGQKLQGTFRLQDLDERVRCHNLLADKDAEITFALAGGKDRLQRLFLELCVCATVHLVCHRCLEPAPFELDEKVRVVLFADETVLDEAMLADEELEGMLLEPETDVCTLVEDQILMALPFSAVHDDCVPFETETPAQEKPNPFAVLAGLKKAV